MGIWMIQQGKSILFRQLAKPKWAWSLWMPGMVAGIEATRWEGSGVTILGVYKN